MTNIQQVRCFYLWDVSMNSFNPIRSLENCWSARRGPNTGRSSNSSSNSTKCVFQDFEQVFGDWKSWPKMGVRLQTCSNAKRSSLFTNNGSKTPKHECKSSSTALQLGYRHHNFLTNCPKQSSHCRCVCSLTNGVCQVKASQRRALREWATEDVHWTRIEWGNILFFRRVPFFNSS